MGGQVAARSSLALPFPLHSVPLPHSLSSKAMVGPDIFLIGESSRCELGPVRAALEGWAAWRAFACLAGAINLTKAESPCLDLVVLWQDRTGRHAREQVEQLRQASPLARWICVFGPWCEGEFRSGRPLPGMLRCPWHAARAFFARNRELANCGGGPTWLKPETASDEEHALAAWDDAPKPVAPAGHATIVGPDAEFAATLAGMLNALGWSSTWLRSFDDRPVAKRGALAIVDSPQAGIDRDTLTRAVQWSAGAPVLAACGFPRPHDLAAAQACGAEGVLAKPVRLESLQAATARVGRLAGTPISAAPRSQLAFA